MKDLKTETLELLQDYVGELANLSRRLAQKAANREHTDLSGLIDGLETLTQASNELRIAAPELDSKTARALEPELAQLLQELLDAVENRDRDSERKILESSLPDHLKQWSPSTDGASVAGCASD